MLGSLFTLPFLAIAVIAAAVVGFARAIPSHPDALTFTAIEWAAVVVTIRWMVGAAPRGRPSRPVVEDVQRVPACNRWYIESGPHVEARHSCSFIEFDERGDYLDFLQHRHAYQTIGDMALSGQPLTVVIYVHGWRHGGQSNDVIAFNEFLHQLALVQTEDGRHRRVHGVYLVWRGAAVSHTLNQNSRFRNVTGYYGEPIVELRTQAHVSRLARFVETFSYFDRKSVAEHKFSGTALSRSIFSCAFAAKRNSSDCQVMLFGHSFGALLLERTFQNAAISQLTSAWPWTDDRIPADVPVNPLPFDSVLLVNSAAPSIYAKQFQGYLAAHRQAMLRAGVRRADIPFVFSITSSVDRATGAAHPLANSLCVILPTLARTYGIADFTVERTGPNDAVTIPQAYYYRRTPGHNPLLVNRFIERVIVPRTADSGRSHVRRNLQAKLAELTEFDVTDGTGSGSVRWRVGFPPSTRPFVEFSTYGRQRPVVWTKQGDSYVYKETAYWIIRCPREIIGGHNDIWNQAAMDVYAALHRIALQANPGAR